MSTICIFEDSNYSKLLPLCWIRAIFELRCGINTILEKIVRQYTKCQIALYCREYLQDVLKERYNYSVNVPVDDDCLFINGRVIIKENIPVFGDEEIGLKNETVVYVRVKKEKAVEITPEKISNAEYLKNLKNNFKNKLLNTEIKLVTYPWDLVHYNPEEIKSDFEISQNIGIDGKIYDGVYILNKSQVYVGKGAEIKPGVVLDAENGPIYIDEEVTVQPNAVIEGPCFIGKKSMIRIGAKIRTGTSIGEVSRVGGEVEESIIHSYSNKQHDGFLGHAYIGSWCNLGAGTNNSDLKNNYNTVKVYIEGKLIDSGSLFVGLIMGEHSKTAIGTNFNTGTVVGVSANVFGVSSPPKFIPSFSWGVRSEEKGFTLYRLEDAIATAKTVMSRRKITLTKAEETLLRKVFELTDKERTIAFKE